jgi:hemerythrin superfamily protein
MACTISDAIKKDHREIESYYENILNSSDETEQTRWQNQFTWELARHSIGEELVVYPAFEKYVSGGMDLANKDRQAHRSVGIHVNDLHIMPNF